MVPHNKPTLGIEETEAAKRVILSSMVAQGTEVEKFENEICDFLELPQGHAVAVSSGSSALYLALLALKPKNKMVAIPSYVCSSLRNAIAMAGSKELIIDTAENSPNIDIDSLNAEKFDIAIIPHMFGIPCDLSKIKKNCLIIEDCAQAIGSKIKGKYTGAIGNIGVFSFYATKLMTSGGQGGMVVSKDKKYIDFIKDYREFDCRKDKKIRFNFQMTDIQAAIGREQLKKLPDFLQKREEIFQMYEKAGFDMVKSDNKDFLSVRYRAVLKTKIAKEIIEKLNDNNIKSIIPIEEWELLDRTKNALIFSNKTLSLPIYPSLEFDVVRNVINIVRSAI